MAMIIFNMLMINYVIFAGRLILHISEGILEYLCRPMSSQCRDAVTLCMMVSIKAAVWLFGIIASLAIIRA